MALVKMRVEILVTIEMEENSMRSAETQIADFVLPALDQLQEETEDVREVSYTFTEL